MKITPVVEQLRTYCPVFAGRVGGGIDMDAVKASQQLVRPAAFVVATGDDADDNDIDNGVRQVITDSFDVLVVLDAKDQRGQLAVDVLHDIRAALWRALIGWKPASEYDPITYDGGELLEISRALVLYRYSFVAEFQLGRSEAAAPAETWGELVLDGLSPLEGVDIDVDCIDPADPNLQSPGPDGRIEFQLKEDLS